MGRAAALSALVVLGACSVEHRPQLVVTITTDMVLPAQVESDDTLSAAASIDRIRVDVLGANGELRDTHGFVVRDAESFPLSFGVAALNSGERIDLRIVAYRASWAESTPNGPVPSPGVSIDRLVRTNIGAVTNTSVVLHGDCVGIVADVASGKTCVDAQRHDAAADDSAADAPAMPGDWSSAHSRDCATQPRAGTKCIAGGLSSIGDPALAQVDAASDLIPAPPRMLRISPFFLDTTEVTVAKLRSVAAMLPSLPTLQSADPRCNYTAAADTTDGDPVRCVPFEVARAACVAMGATLPTEAQWEHAARGRGKGTRYPWGDAAPTCCTASLGGGAFGCSPIIGTGKHANPSTCNGTADVSIDGVVDLGGGVREWVLDSAQSFDDCVAAGVADDPVCGGSGATGSVKGGSYVTQLEWASSALRRTAAFSYDVGFRCAWVDR